jgi:fluoride ion exporter CrcB/FEX
LTYESSALLERGSVWSGILNLIGSLAAGLLAVRLGIFLARRF